MYKTMRMQYRSGASVDVQIQTSDWGINEWHDCWRQTGWFGYFWNWFSWDFHTTVPNWREEKEKTHPVSGSSVKHLVNERGRMGATRQVGAVTRAVETRITALYYCGEQESFSGRATRWDMRQAGHDRTFHARFYSCQSREETRGCSGQRFPNRTGVDWPNKNRQWIRRIWPNRPCVYRAACWWCNGVYVFLGTLRGPSLWWFGTPCDLLVLVRCVRAPVCWPALWK